MLMESSSVAERRGMPLEVDGANPSSLPKKFFSFFRKVYLNWLTGSPVAQLHRAVGHPRGWELESPLGTRK